MCFPVMLPNEQLAMFFWLTLKSCSHKKKKKPATQTNKTSHTKLTLIISAI
jgi:hypothetical protein